MTRRRVVNPRGTAPRKRTATRVPTTRRRRPKEGVSPLNAPASIGPPVPPHLEGLDDRERIFVLAYLSNGLNQTYAYRAAHPRAGPATARVQGCRYRWRPAIAAAIQARLAVTWKQLDMEVAEAIARVCLIIRADPRDAVGDRGRFLPLNRWPDSLALAVEAYDGDEKKFRLASKLQALRTILELKKEIGGANDLASLIAAARAEGDKVRGDP